MTKHSKILALLLTVFFVLALAGISQTQSDETVTCPVSGKEIKKSEAKGSYEYQGKIYYFCCESCKEPFMKDPEKYIQKKTEMQTVYTCPMHPEVKSDKPGECPKCGMNLEKKMMPMEHLHKEGKMPGMMHMFMMSEGKACCSMMELMTAGNVEMNVENLEDGVTVKMTSKNPETVKKIQKHAAEMIKMCEKKEK